MFPFVTLTLVLLEAKLRPEAQFLLRDQYAHWKLNCAFDSGNDTS